MAKQTVNLQDSFLNQVRREGRQIDVHLVNGRRIQGKVEGFDNFTVILNDGNSQRHLIYKHAISTLSPIQRGGRPQNPRKEVFNTSLRRGLEDVGKLSGLKRKEG